MAHLKRYTTGFTSQRVLKALVAPSGYKSLIGATDNIDFGTSYSYIPTIDGLVTYAEANTTWNLDQMEQRYQIDQIEIPCYIIKAKWRYNKLESENFSKNIPGSSLQTLQDKLAEAAIDMKLRQMVIHGNTANGGLLSNSTQVNLSGGWKKLDPGVLLSELLIHIGKMLADVQGRGSKIVIMMHSELQSYLYSALINTSKYLQSGSTFGTAGALSKILSHEYGKQVEIVQDNTLVGTGSGVDQVFKMLVVVPDLVDSSAFGGEELLQLNSDSDLISTYMAVSNMSKQINPEIDGMLSGYAHMTASEGVSVRKEGVLVISAKINNN